MTRLPRRAFAPPRALPRALPRAARRGAALPTALVMLVVLAALAGGAFAMSTQSFRGGRNALVEQRAFAVAEAGLNRQIGTWNQSLNAAPGAGGVRLDETVTASIYVADGDTAFVNVTRLDPFLFAVHAVGRASIPNPQLQATRTVQTLVRIAYPSVNPRGAITTNGDVDVQGNAFRADGNDRVPYAGSSSQWDPNRCADLMGTNMHAVAVPPTGTVKAKDATLLGLPGADGQSVLKTPIAGDPNTYIAFGTETMNTLIQNADRRFTSTSLPSSIGPRLDPVTGQCNVNDPANWGEPWGGAGSVTRCQSYFPIIYVDGDASIQSNGRGQGILIVNGDLTINGTFDWLGIVLVRDDLNKGNGSATITGAVMAGNVDFRDGGTYAGGTQNINYSRCAIESALRGSAILIRVRERAWAQLF